MMVVSSLTGERYSFGTGSTDVYLIKTDPFGNMEWQTTFGTAYYDDNGWCVQQTTDGEYIITGTYKDDPNPDIYLIKVYPSGTLHWWKGIGTNYSEWGSWVEQTTEGGYIITGGQMALDPGNVYLVKTDALGNVDWVQTFGGMQSDVGWCVQQTDLSDPGYIITGGTSSFGNGRQVWLIKTDEYGNMEWNKRFGWTDWDEGRCVRQTFPDRGYIINGVGRAPEGIFMWLIKTDTLGNLQWEKRLRPTTTSAARGYSVQQTSDGGYIAVGEAMLVNDMDVYIVKVDKNGNIEWQKTIDRAGTDDHGYAVDIIDEDSYVIAGATDHSGPPYYDVYLVKLAPSIYDTDDPLALSYNGNRHLVRNPNSEALHLVYTRENKIIYQYSPNGGTNWTLPVDISTGKLPAITLSAGYLPSVTWTDDMGGLWYRRQTAPGVWSEIYHLYDPWGIWQPKLNAPPSIVITPHSTGDSVHIICTMHNPANGPINGVAEYSFRMDNPMAGSFSYIEGGVGTDGSIRSFPSIARCNIDTSLHTVWQRADTICYATRQIGQPWDNWDWQFSNKGLQSSHPYVETYGDMVYVVWQHKERPGAREEVYKGWKDLSAANFDWQRFSRTPNTASLFPVSASGVFTVYVDEITPYPNHGEEIFYKIHPEDTAYDISQTLAWSTYPQAVCRFTPANSYLYTAWLDGNGPVYEIRFKKIAYIPLQVVAYLTAVNGYATPSPYLVARDSFIADWQIPVDIGYQTITYRFPLETGYRYKIKVIAYHESAGQWREWVKTDNGPRRLIKYNAYKPETLEFWIPPALYKDGVIDVVFDRISGAFATAGPIYIYQYEYEEELASGPMAQEGHSLTTNSTIIFPNPFVKSLTIKLAKSQEGRTSIRIYDISGKLVKHLYEGVITPHSLLTWDGTDDSGKITSQGIYFVQIRDYKTGKFTVHKVLKLE